MNTITISKGALVWTTPDFDGANDMSNLIFGQMIWAFTDEDEFYSIAPVNDSVEKKRLWALDRNNFEIGRYDDVDQAKEAARWHRLGERMERHR